MSALLVPFLYELRKRQLKVGTEELVALAKGMALGLHESTLDASIASRVGLSRANGRRKNGHIRE